MTSSMTFREAVTADISEIQIVRNAVKENVLSNPSLVTDQDCVEFLTVRGKGWVCIQDNKVVGFAIADLQEKNVWALFVHPEYEKRGIGKTLHDMMLNWYFTQRQGIVWLSTAANSYAEKFYRKLGWIENGKTSKGEIKFEMDEKQWKEIAGLL
jgi:ribosomal protein S18 acetylase RimI-like enzyme